MLEKITVPNSASTIDGVPAIISTVDSTIRARPKGRPNSLSQTAIATPTGSAIAIPITATMKVPTSGSRKPPVSAWLKPVFGDVVSSCGPHVLDALDEQVDHDRRGDRAEEQPEGPADGEPDPVRQPPGGARLRRSEAVRRPSPPAPRRRLLAPARLLLEGAHTWAVYFFIG